MPWVQAASKAIQTAVSTVTETQGIPMHRDSAWNVEWAFVQNVRRELIRKQFTEHFRRLARDRSITAWVGLNDEIAIEALIYLRSNDVRVPGDISLMGFDDSIEAGFQGLTSYCFNGASAMHLMAEYIVRPDSPLMRAGNGKPVIIKGFVHERATTGRARVQAHTALASPCSKTRDTQRAAACRSPASSWMPTSYTLGHAPPPIGDSVRRT